MGRALDRPMSRAVLAMTRWPVVVGDRGDALVGGQRCEIGEDPLHTKRSRSDGSASMPRPANRSAMARSMRTVVDGAREPLDDVPRLRRRPLLVVRRSASTRSHRRERATLIASRSPSCSAVHASTGRGCRSSTDVGGTSTRVVDEHRGIGIDVDEHPSQRGGARLKRQRVREIHAEQAKHAAPRAGTSGELEQERAIERERQRADRVTQRLEVSVVVVEPRLDGRGLVVADFQGRCVTAYRSTSTATTCARRWWLNSRTKWAPSPNPTTRASGTRRSSTCAIG